MRDEKGYVGRCISVIHRHFKMYLNDRLSSYKLNGAEALILLMLGDEDGISQETLVDKLHFDKGVMARVAKQLENKGYIIRQVNPEDKRAYQLFLTEKAKNFNPITLKLLDEWNTYIMSNLSDEEFYNLKNTLENMSERAFIKSREAKEALENEQRKNER